MDEKSNRRLSAKEYDRFAAASDRLTADMDTALLGLVGEVGSLVSALKKKRRDTDGFLGYHDAVLEELGDVLWYVSAVARRGGTSLQDVVARAAGGTQEQTDVALDQLAPSPGGSIDERAFERALLELAGEAGDLAKRFVGAAYRDNVDALRGAAQLLSLPAATLAQREKSRFLFAGMLGASASPRTPNLQMAPFDSRDFALPSRQLKPNSTRGARSGAIHSFAVDRPP